MTRKEIEKRCLEEMQQTIPDSEALWQRIEEQLPQQQEKLDEQNEPVRMTHMRRIMAAAACFLLIAAGVQVFSSIQPMQMENDIDSNTPSDTYSNEEDNAQPEQIPEQATEQNTEPSGIRSYASLNLESNGRELVIQNQELLGLNDEYFREETVLENAECFVDVQVESGSQHPDTGEMNYHVTVVDAYGTETLHADDTFILHSMSAYLLQPGHEYVLPLYQKEGQWHLVNESAPQIELTLDDEAVFHNGWRSLMNSHSEPLLYEQQGEDDYFYDRMYLTEWVYVEKFLTEWEEAQNA